MAKYPWGDEAPDVALMVRPVQDNAVMIACAFSEAMPTDPHTIAQMFTALLHAAHGYSGATIPFDMYCAEALADLQRGLKALRPLTAVEHRATVADDDLAN